MDIMGLFENLFGSTPDRTWRNNSTDGQTFYGYDDKDGNTTWYDKNGYLDSRTPTPTQEEQDQNDAGY